MAKQYHEVQQRGNASSEVSVVEEHTDKVTVTKHDHSVEYEVEKENGPISEWENVPHFEKEGDETYRHKEDRS